MSLGESVLKVDGFLLRSRCKLSVSPLKGHETWLLLMTRREDVFDDQIFAELLVYFVPLRSPLME